MSLATNIARRAGSARYYARQTVPIDLVGVFGKRELWRSLRTTDPREAKRLVRAVLDEWDLEFARARARTSLSEHDIQEAVWNRYVELTEADEQFRQSLPSDDDLDAVWIELEKEFGKQDLEAFRVFEYVRDRFEISQQERAERLAALRADAARGNTRLVADEAQRIAKAKGVVLAKGSDDFRKLAQGLQRSELEALTRAAERDQGDFTGSPRDALVRPPSAYVAAPSIAPGESIAELFDAYAAENPEQVKPDTLNQSRMAVDLFIDHVGARFPVKDINKKVVGAWKRLLLRYPVKAAETNMFRGMSLKEIVAANDAADEATRKPVISPKTVNRYLSGLGAFSEWLVINEYLPASPLEDMFIKIDKTKRIALPFSTPDMRTLFSSPLFVGCQSDDKMHLPGNVAIRDHRYWLPLVMLFSGARPGEIAQLLVDDVREMHGRWIMHITEEGDGTKSVKTKGSQRVVPIHPELVRLGFVEFCKEKKKGSDKRLFPEAERNERGQIAAKFSREFGRYLTRIGIKDGRGLSLYSFRHGFVDALRRAELLDEQFGLLIGHVKHSTTGQYGVLPQGMLRQRVEMIEAVTFPDLDVSHLYRT
jgi:integrase